MPMTQVAVVQARVAPDLATGLTRTAELTAEAAGAGATLVVFPETWLPGYPAWLDVCRDVALWDHGPVKQVFAAMASQSVVVAGASGAALGRVASDAGVTLVVGVIERLEAGPGRSTLYNSLLTYGPDGRLLNHHRKLVPTYTERMVWGIGDAASPPVSQRMACATALPMAQLAAANLLAELEDRPLKPFRHRFVGRCFSLGRRRGLLQFVRADDSSLPFYLWGGLAAWTKEKILSGIALGSLKRAAHRAGR